MNLAKQLSKKEIKKFLSENFERLKIIKVAVQKEIKANEKLRKKLESGENPFRNQQIKSFV
ncbi:hypothetical protein J4403_04040 [Candidatus Woesearchaeota archaeon]|nr:hypothetical protein [Candidatus Woesearchaeota archaeon]